MTNEELSKRDYVIAIDKSGSMGAKHKNTTRWKYAQEQTEALARKCAEFDSDGIDVILFAGSVKTYNGVTPDKVSQIFSENEPSGNTATDLALKTVFDAYFSKKAAGNAKPVTCLVLTDGQPNDQDAVANIIIDAANRIDADEELAVSFIQVGDDAGARAFLQYLDDNLQAKGAKFDIVDCKNEEEMENMTLTDILVAAVND
jgi:Mg-chelatase subunit ChlD